MEREVQKETKVFQYEICSADPEDEISYSWLNYSYPHEHRHDYWGILLVTEGTLVHRINGLNLRMRSGDVCLVRPQDTHLFFVEDEKERCQYLNILIRMDYATRLFDLFGEKGSLIAELEARHTPLCFTLSEVGLKKTVTGILNLSSQKIPREARNCQLKLLVQRVIGGMVEQLHPLSQSLPEWLTDFFRILNDPYIYTTDVKELASHTPYSYSRLAPLFKSLTGWTIIEYVTRVKMSCAKELLQGSDMQILEISVRLNYESLSHFIRTFKKEIGMTPSEYRKRTRHATQ